MNRSVFLGQNFSCIVNIINKTKRDIENVAYSVELVTPRNKYQLKDRRSSHAHKTDEKLPVFAIFLINLIGTCKSFTTS